MTQTTCNCGRSSARINLTVPGIGRKVLPSQELQGAHSMMRTAALVTLFSLVAMPAGFAGAPATDCDHLAASPQDPGRPSGIAGVSSDAIDEEKAVPACRQALAAHPGDPRLSMELARALEKSGGSDKEIAQLYKAAHDGGNLAATTHLAGLYEEGRGVEADPAMAQKLYLQAAQGGIGSAMNSLGIMARDGTLGQKHMAESAGWFRRAADAGDVDGMFNYAMLLAEGSGVGRDPRQAVALFAKASGLGHLRSKVWLGEMYANGAGVAEDYSKAIALFEEAAAANDPRGINDLAFAYAEGHGVQRDIERAEAMFERAGGLGESNAYYHLARLYEDGRTGATDSGKAAEYLIKALTNGSPKAVRDVNDRLQGWQSQTIGALQQILQDENLFSGPLDGSFSPELGDALLQMSSEE